MENFKITEDQHDVRDHEIEWLKKQIEKEKDLEKKSILKLVRDASHDQVSKVDFPHPYFF